MNQLEHDHQTAFFEWLRSNQQTHPFLAFFFAIPNGGLRSKRTASRLYKEGVKRGVLDTFLPVPRDDMHGLWIEFKAGKNKLTPQQADWQAFLKGRGYAVYVVYDWMEAARITVDYLGLGGHRPADSLTDLKNGK